MLTKEYLNEVRDRLENTPPRRYVDDPEFVMLHNDVEVLLVEVERLNLIVERMPCSLCHSDYQPSYEDIILCPDCARGVSLSVVK